MKLNNKGFGVIATLLALVSILAMGGGAYYLKKSSKTTLPVNVEENNLTEENQNNVIDTSTQNIKKDCLPTTSPWIKVLSPNGGETYTAGQKITIKWNSCNVSSDDNIVVIALQKNGEWEDITYLGHSATINGGNETFIIPVVPLGNYKIRIAYDSANKNNQDFSDNLFTINSNNLNNILRKKNETCGENIGDCEAGLKCAYPCGIPGCQNVCMPKDAPPVP